MVRFLNGVRSAVVIGVWLLPLLVTGYGVGLIFHTLLMSRSVWDVISLGGLAGVFLCGCWQFVVFLRRRHMAFAHIRTNPGRYFSLLAKLNDTTKRLVVIGEDGHGSFEFMPSDDFDYSRVAGLQAKRSVARSIVFVSDDCESVYNPETLRDDYYASVTVFRWYSLSSRVAKERFLKQITSDNSLGADEEGYPKGSMFIKADGTDSVDPKDVWRLGPIVVTFRGRRENHADDAGLDVDTSAIDHHDYATCEDLEELLRVLESQ
jgi:hypothetical protein